MRYEETRRNQKTRHIRRDKTENEERERKRKTEINLQEHDGEARGVVCGNRKSGRNCLHDISCTTQDARRDARIPDYRVNRVVGV
jgi:hypothetical protein